MLQIKCSEGALVMGVGVGLMELCRGSYPRRGLGYSEVDTMLLVMLLLNGASEHGAKNIRVHMLADGRDVLDGSSVGFAETLEAELASLRSKGIDAHG
ncbi:2,3-bisphosphoglycerate-independent phosphoglycerate mutase [Tanacetum coccineum]